jgi:5-(carboxyamino)imidazole ribonucleotide mutase
LSATTSSGVIGRLTCAVDDVQPTIRHSNTAKQRTPVFTFFCSLRETEFAARFSLSCKLLSTHKNEVCLLSKTVTSFALWCLDLARSLSNDDRSIQITTKHSKPMMKTQQNESSRPLVAVIMGSKSDWETMRHADEALTTFGVEHECRIVSAHRTPALMAEFAAEAEARGIEVIIAGAGGSAHLPGMVAAQTLIPVLGVPVESHALKGMDSLLSIVQMPGGIPVGTLAIGKAGATNAALLAIAILANSRPDLRERLRRFREEQTDKVLNDKLPA